MKLILENTHLFRTLITKRFIFFLALLLKTNQMVKVFSVMSNCHTCVLLLTCKNEEKLHGKFVGKGNEGKFTCISCLIAIILTHLLPCVPLDLCPPSSYYLHNFFLNDLSL